MATYWLTFKPKGPSAPRGWPIEKLQELIKRFEIDPVTATEWWRFVSQNTASIGDRIYLFKQGDDPRGIFGVGWIVGLSKSRSDNSGDETLRPRANIRFEKIVDPTTSFLLRLDEIDDLVSEDTINAQSSGQEFPNHLVSEIESRLAPILRPLASPLRSEEADDAAFDPDSFADLRERALRAIRIRRGQAAFRAKLMEAYDKRCAITRCPIADVLEAAHITPYRGLLTNEVSNGLLLRADIHTLFDCGLMAIHPDTRGVVIADALNVSTYKQFAGRVVWQPKNDEHKASKKSLQRHFLWFEELQKNL